MPVNIIMNVNKSLYVTIIINPLSDWKGETACVQRTLKVILSSIIKFVNYCFDKNIYSDFSKKNVGVFLFFI